MKKTIFFLAATLMVSAAFAQAQKLTYNLKKGETYRQNMEIESMVKQSMMGQTMEVSVLMEMNTASEVAEVTKEGYNLTTSYNKIAMNTSAMGTSVSYSSDGTDEASTLFKSMTGKPFSVAMTKQGEITGVTGLSVLTEEIVTSTTGGMEVEQLKASLNEQFNDEAFSNQFKNSTFVYPDKALSVGDSWTQNSTVKSTFDMNVETKYTVKSISKTDAVLDIASTITVQEQGMEIQGIPAIVHMSGSQTGSSTIDVATGWPISSKMEQSIQGEIEVQGMKIPMEVKTISTISNK